MRSRPRAIPQSCPLWKREAGTPSAIATRDAGTPSRPRGLKAGGHAVGHPQPTASPRRRESRR